MQVLLIGAAAGVAIITAWFISRWMGRGKPCPVWLATFFDNPLTEALSGSATLVERAGVVSGMRVLDAGCGPGRLTLPLARRVGTGGEVVALDVQEGMLERVRHNAKTWGLTNVRTVLGALDSDAPALEPSRAAFDRVLLVAVLGEIPDRAEALRSLYAVLKPGGILSITEMIIDPDYQPRYRVRRLAEGAGFHFDRSFGTVLMFTMNFRKPT